MQMGMTERDGSAYFEMGGTKVMVTVGASEDFSLSVAPQNHLISTQLTSLFDKCVQSKCQVDIVILQRDGGVMACCVNATSLALADAGMEMPHLLLGLHVGWDKDGCLLVDPGYREARQNATATYVYAGDSLIASLPHTPVPLDYLLDETMVAPHRVAFHEEIRQQMRSYVSQVLDQRSVAK